MKKESKEVDRVSIHTDAERYSDVIVGRKRDRKESRDSLPVIGPSS